jgi:hypothetical protein
MHFVAGSFGRELATAAHTVPSPTQRPLGHPLAARLLCNRALSAAFRCACPAMFTPGFPLCPAFRYTQQLAQEGLGILLAAWNVSQMAPSSMMSSMISVQVSACGPSLAMPFIKPLVGTCCDSSGLSGRQVSLFVRHLKQQIRFISPVIASRASLFSNYNIMVSGAVSVLPPFGNIPCYFRLSAQVDAAAAVLQLNAASHFLCRSTLKHVTIQSWPQPFLTSSATFSCSKIDLYLVVVPMCFCGFFHEPANKSPTL